MPEFIAIAGNIGSGKSSLTTLLSQKFGWKPYYEIVETNPYLADFYKDMKRWSFHLQMFFLTKRFQHQQELIRSETTVLQDRTIYEDAEIFAKNLYLHGKMEERDYRTYAGHFNLMTSFLKVPDLLIYLKADVKTLMERIALRGRDYERTIPAEYLTQLNTQYEAWTSSYNKGRILRIDVSKLDFVNSAKDLDKVASLISWELECLRNKSQTALPLTNLSEPKKTKKRASRSEPELTASL
ncbi:MAG: Deoxyadenosine/deoxycytidine kinase [Bacteriovoracaceae bacterium]|nr:Deoxyadenosine/deoxycytidine kinase [Bacteriovoracaceae bacterium]